MDRLFVQQYYQLHSITFKFQWHSKLYSELWILRFWFDSHWKHTPFSIWLFRMDVTYSMVSVNTGDIRENNRRDIVINYCKTLDTDFPILQKTLINFSHLHDIRKL